MNMTKAEKLYEYMKMVTGAGYYLPIERDNGEICISCPFKDRDNDQRFSGWSQKLNDVKENLGNFSGYSKKAFIRIAQEQKWKPLEPFMLPITPLPNGTKVKYDGEICGVSEWNDYEYILNEKDGSYTVSSSSEFTPIFEEQEDETIMIHNGKKYKVNIIEEIN